MLKIQESVQNLL